MGLLGDVGSDSLDGRGVTSLLSTSAIEKEIQALLDNDPTIPEGHRGALVVYANTTMAEVALATRVTDGWTVDLVASHSWTGDNQIGVISRMTW